ncbi:MAG: hypothetical protein ACD_75C00306G0002 [uncultured bacterium]|nr:MAG: hypothetical protein ACD_75C00306G0002 [uncultured bacterium]
MGHQFQCGDLFGHCGIEMAVFDGQACLTGKNLKTGNVVIRDWGSGNEVVDNHYPQRFTRGAERRHYKGRFAEEVDEIIGNDAIRRLAIHHMHRFIDPAGMNENMVVGSR